MDSGIYKRVLIGVAMMAILTLAINYIESANGVTCSPGYLFYGATSSLGVPNGGDCNNPILYDGGITGWGTGAMLISLGVVLWDDRPERMPRISSEHITWGHRFRCWQALKEGRIRKEGAELQIGNLKFEDNGWEAYALKEIFVDEAYRQLAVKGLSVIDIGASIADTPIYFASQGALQVCGYEPDRERYEEGKRNIERNGMHGRITLHNAPYDGKVGDVLKIDCEGCEYALIPTLARKGFKQIIMEVHNGLGGIVEPLKENGYVILESPKGKQGILFAVKGESNEEADKVVW